MNQISVSSFVALIVGLSVATICQSEDVRRPNLLLLVADDLGFADVGFQGSRVIATPHLDRLAATGVILDDFRVCPMCSPTRAGLLTGRWPHRFGLMRAVIPPWSDYGLPPHEITLAERLEELGYGRRGIVGKWHLGHSRQAYLPLQQGFTRFVGHYNGAIDYFTHEREGQRDWHHDERSIVEPGYATDLIGRHAVEFINASPTNEPWMLYVPFNAPHSPYQAKEDDREKYSQLKRPNRRAYAAMVDSLDQAIGNILEAVEARSDAEHTLVLFFSDNGGVRKLASNAPYRGAKLTVYEGGTRVCAAIRWPAGGLSGGKRFAGRIGYIDVLPTLLAAAGASPAADLDAADLDGVDVLPALKGQQELPPRPWFTYMHQSGEAQASVHQGDWKLVAHGDVFAAEFDGPSSRELYDLKSDPGETTDLAEQHPQKVDELQRLLEEFGSWQQPGVTAYAEGRDAFVAPEDWIITTP